jgi:hypothetical protein
MRINKNYHWKDGFFWKNHPLKEAESRVKDVSQHYPPLQKGRV